MNCEWNRLFPGGPLYCGDKVGTDSLCLAAECVSQVCGHGCDLGCGSGIIMLLLLWERPDLFLSGIELRPNAAEECRQNIKKNGWEARSCIIDGDFRIFSFPSGSMDFVVSNPPYFPAGCGQRSPDKNRALMRTETATIDELCREAYRLLKPGAPFFLVHRTERKDEVLSALDAAGLSPEAIRFFSSNADRKSSLFLCKAVKSASASLRTLPPIYQWGTDGKETAQYRKICHWEEA